MRTEKTVQNLKSQRKIQPWNWLHIPEVQYNGDDHMPLLDNNKEEKTVQNNLFIKRNSLIFTLL